MMHLTRVLLPAPLPPRRAWKVPGGSLRETLSRATRGPKRLVMLMASRRGGALGSNIAFSDRAWRLPGNSCETGFLGCSYSPQRHRDAEIHREMLMIFEGFFFLSSLWSSVSLCLCGE